MHTDCYVLRSLAKKVALLEWGHRKKGFHKNTDKNDWPKMYKMPKPKNNQYDKYNNCLLIKEKSLTIELPYELIFLDVFRIRLLRIVTTLV